MTFTATVTANGSAVTSGAVQFSDGATLLGSPVTVNASGVATLSTSGLAEGTHSIGAAYGGAPGSSRAAARSRSASTTRRPSTAARSATRACSPCRPPARRLPTPRTSPCRVCRPRSRRSPRPSAASATARPSTSTSCSSVLLGRTSCS
ncbi:Ig-like domain-containing protein [Agromyces protaetiae]|uniref:Ig-like domain-containing protein n=1 Tax=Agromyces protaetiae TaxID=2509455 RepID=UPI003C7B0887